MVGLGNIDNTNDLAKPMSTATQTALNLLAPLANPRFTGTISGNTNFTVDATGNLTAYSITSNNNITCTDLLYAGGTQLTSTINGKANLSGATFSGTVASPNLVISTGGVFITKSGLSTTSAIDSFGNITSYGGSIAMTSGVLTKYYCDSNGNVSNSGTLTVDGAISAPTINLNGTSIATSLAACAKKTSGSIAGTTAFQTIYTVVQGTRGFITVVAVAPNYNMFMGFFEWTAGGSYQVLTQLAQSGNAPQTALNTTNSSSGGTVNLTVQQVSSTGPIQAKMSTNGTINWYVMLM